eukprot:9265236-Pyramimonas_sp.AAC.1
MQQRAPRARAQAHVHLLANRLRSDPTRADARVKARVPQRPAGGASRLCHAGAGRRYACVMFAARWCWTALRLCHVRGTLVLDGVTLVSRSRHA